MSLTHTSLWLLEILRAFERSPCSGNLPSMTHLRRLSWRNRQMSLTVKPMFEWCERGEVRLEIHCWSSNYISPKNSNDLVILLRSLNFDLPKSVHPSNCNEIVRSSLQSFRWYFRSISKEEIFWQKISIVTWLWNITAGAATTTSILWKEIFGCYQGNRLYELNLQYY